MATNNSGNLALLIDGDNVSYKLISGLMAEVANYGTASVRRIYADWTNPTMRGWKTCLLDHSIIPIQQFAYTSGKNSTDGAMIIDAMDLLYTNRFASFCIVSSDSDFTRLAARIREQGVTVYGFGERKTHKAFVAACSKFVYFDVLPGCEIQTAPENEQEESQQITTTHQQAPEPLLATTSAEATPRGPPPVPHFEPPKRPLDQAAIDGLAKAIKASINTDDNYANLANVGTFLSKISPDLNARNYGYDRLREFVEASGIVHLKWKKTGDNPPVAYVCLKDFAEG